MASGKLLTIKRIRCMKKLMAVCLVAAIFAVANASGATIDLSGASSDNLITAPGGSFAMLFAGQTVVGISGISGSPTGPLTLAPDPFWALVLGYCDPVVSPASWAIHPEPGNIGPLSLLLDTEASSITWTMGYADGPATSVDIDFYASDGSLVHSMNQMLLVGYNVYSFGGFGSFAGLTIYNDDDFGGVRFQNFEYVPEPATIALFGFGVLSLLRRKK
jgi:hypothetical protein